MPDSFTSRRSARNSVRPGGVEAVRRLVEDEEVGIVDERARELAALARAGREPVDRPVPHLAEPDVVQDLVRALERPVPRHPRELAAQRDGVDGGQLREVAVPLGHVADAAPHGVAARHDVDAEDGRAALGRPQQSEDRLEERALARAVRPEEPGGRALDPERDAVERTDRAVADGQAVGLDERVGHRRRLGDRAQTLH